jgi:hypothetical protein
MGVGVSNECVMMMKGRNDRPENFLLMAKNYLQFFKLF